MPRDKRGKKPAYLPIFWRYVAFAVLVWTAVIGGSLVWNFHLQDKQFAELVHKEAIANFDKDQGFRLWGTKHGGVYVPVTEETPPSPYLAHIPERDIETPSGRRLTLMNPAYMVRQLMEDYTELYGVRGHITGLVVLRPGNAPDEWEKRALVQLKAGADEVMANTEIDGELYHRMMRPMYMKPGCEKCHGHLGFKLGDFRGGVSVSVPLAPYVAARREGAGLLALSHGLIWLLGLGGVGVGARQVRNRIEERDRADEQLETHRARFENLLNLSPDAFVVIDEARRIQLFSQGAANTFGYRPDEVLGEPIEILMPEEFRGDHGAHVRDFAASGQSTRLFGERGDLTGRRKDGSTFPAEASVARLDLADETLFTATLRDVTERNERDQILRQAQKMEAVGQLTGGVAHDFNNLLTVVLGNLELLRDGAAGNAAQIGFAESAIRATERGALLTQRLLAFSRKQTLNPKGLDLNELVAGMLDLLQRTLGETIEIEAESADDPWPALADPAQMESALLNLALNARDAMPVGGRLMIETSNVRFDDEYAEAQADIAAGEYVQISVSDTGTGMPADVMEHVFEPFYTTKDVGEGSGLGLSMVYGFAKQSGGHVTVTSEENRGTTVSLYLPRATLESPEADEDAAPDEPKAMDETILVVEDDPDVRTLAVTLLGDLGYEVLEAGDGYSAVSAIKSRPRIDLLFTDVVLAGGMSGPEVAEEAKRLQPAMRILFMSGYPSEAMVRRGQLEQDAELLNKPFRKADLARKVREVLRKAA
jgi:PAS domain S-box-containing protein